MNERPHRGIPNSVSTLTTSRCPLKRAKEKIPAPRSSPHTSRSEARATSSARTQLVKSTAVPFAICRCTTSRSPLSHARARIRLSNSAGVRGGRYPPGPKTSSLSSQCGSSDLSGLVRGLGPNPLQGPPRHGVERRSRSPRTAVRNAELRGATSARS
eukprot:scaffold34862_cov61-Phaeocystis_antarctica.AAC.12